MLYTTFIYYILNIYLFIYSVVRIAQHVGS